MGGAGIDWWVATHKGFILFIKLDASEWFCKAIGGVVLGRCGFEMKVSLFSPLKDSKLLNFNMFCSSSWLLGLSDADGTCVICIYVGG